MAEPFLTAAIFLLAGFIQGMSGFGSALVAMPLLSLFLEIKSAVPLCILNSVVITTFLALKMKRHLDRKKIFPLCFAAVPGVVVGATFLKQVASETIQTTLGALLCAYSLYSLFSHPTPRRLPSIWAYLAGFASGAIGSAFSAGGPPTIIYSTLNNWDKDEIKATLSGFFLFNSYLIASVHLASGLTTMKVFTLFLVAAPFSLLGTVLGSHCYGKIDRKTYLKLIFTFLLAMGMIMISTS